MRLTQGKQPQTQLKKHGRENKDNIIYMSYKHYNHITHSADNTLTTQSQDNG